MNAKHWIFEGTDVRDSMQFGAVTTDGSSASGHESDKITEFSPSNVVLLAKGLNPAHAGEQNNLGGSEMVFYEHPSGAGVFSAGSIAYCGGLKTDLVISKLTMNVLDNFLRRPER